MTQAGPTDFNHTYIGDGSLQASWRRPITAAPTSANTASKVDPGQDTRLTGVVSRNSHTSAGAGPTSILILFDPAPSRTGGPGWNAAT